MTTFQYFQRPHLLLAIIIGLIAFLLLTLAAAKVFLSEKPPETLVQPAISTDAKPSTTTEQ